MIKIKDIGWDVGISSESERVKIIKERGLPTELVLTQFDRDERDLIKDFLYDKFGAPVFGYECESTKPNCKISSRKTKIK